MLLPACFSELTQSAEIKVVANLQWMCHYLKILLKTFWILLFFFLLLFICAYKAWFISPPCPHPLPYHPLVLNFKGRNINWKKCLGDGKCVGVGLFHYSSLHSGIILTQIIYVHIYCIIVLLSKILYILFISFCELFYYNK
jgi:hypothetical protein